MSIDEVSERLGALTQGMDDLKSEFHEHKEDEERWQSEVDRKLDLLISDKDQRQGVARAAENKAKVWVAVIAAMVVSVFETVKWMILGHG
jgi:hypothetical protein